MPSEITAAEECLARLKTDVKQHQANRAAAKRTMQKATATRNKEATEFAKLKAEVDANLVAVAKAIIALKERAWSWLFANFSRPRFADLHSKQSRCARC